MQNSSIKERDRHVEDRGRCAVVNRVRAAARPRQDGIVATE